VLNREPDKNRISLREKLNNEREATEKEKKYGGLEKS
jgi:hypothetical protein